MSEKHGSLPTEPRENNGFAKPSSVVALMLNELCMVFQNEKKAIFAIYERNQLRRIDTRYIKMLK
ncbi:hypothetical protein ACX0G7_21335 [Flavitalea antarctica]